MVLRATRGPGLTRRTVGGLMRAPHNVAVARPVDAFRLHTIRRHVDLMRVSSALCPGSAAGR